MTQRSSSRKVHAKYIYCHIDIDYIGIDISIGIDYRDYIDYVDISTDIWQFRNKMIYQNSLHP